MKDNRQWKCESCKEVVTTPQRDNHGFLHFKKDGTTKLKYYGKAV